MNKIYTTTYGKCRSIAGFITGKTMLFIIGLMVVCGTVQSQVSVTATAGVPGPTAYTTLKGAFDAINATTHQGVITISITGTSTETATAVLNSGGYTSVLVRPTAPGATITGNIGGAIVKLNGADNVTFDGFIGAGPARDLTIRNTSTSTTSAVIWVASASGSDAASNNTIKNCTVTGNSNLTTFIGIVSSSGTTLGGVAEAANENNTYQNNAVSAAFYGIALVGPSGNERNNVISNNQIGSTIAASKIGFKGIAIFQQQDVLVSQNIIAGVSGVTGTGANQASGIFVAGTVSGGLIERNSISDVKIAGFWGSNGIQLQSTSPSTNLTIANNMIYDIAAGGFTALDSVDDGPLGIAVVTGGNYNIYYNSIDLLTTTAGLSAAFWTALSGTVSGLNVRNNIFANRQTAGTRFAIYNNTNNAIYTSINNNDYFSTGSVGFLTSTRATLGDWQTATGQDANSVSVNPSFTSATDLHLFFNSPLDALGGTGTGIAIDYDNQARNVTTPDIGADEFTPPPCSSTNGGTVTANPASLCVSGTANLSSTGFSFGIGIGYQWEYFNGAAWVNLPGQTNPNSASTGFISATTQFRLKVTCGAATGFSAPVTVTASTPNVTGSAGGTRCGTGTVNLTATGTGPLYWYTASTGGTSIGTGSPFTTPVISATTTYYVGVTNGITPEAGGMPSSPGTDGSFLTTGWGVVFNATSAFTLTSAVVYPTGTGTVDIGLYNSSGTELMATGPINVTGTGIATPVTLPLGFAVPIGSGYRLLVKNFTGITNLIRDFTAPFPFPSPSGAINVTSGWNGGITTANYFFYNLLISSGCESPRVAVTATVTVPPVFTGGTPTASPATICSGATSNLTVTSANPYTYVWTPGNLVGPSHTVSPTTTTVYTVTATDGSNCVRVGNVTVTVTPAPTSLTVNPANINICSNTPVLITASGGALPGQTIFSETFETFPSPQFTTFGSGIASAQNSTYYQQGANSMRLTNGNFNDGGEALTNNINLSLYTNPSLTFYHICAEEGGFDYGYVQYSIDGGTSWASFPTGSYTGTGVLKNGVVSFDRTSYPDWNSVFTSAAATPGTGPATSLWKLETINLTAYQASNQFRIRFRVTSDVSIQYYGWLIDNVRITGTGQGAVTWSPITNLYHSIGPNVPYVAGVGDSTVYAILPGGSQVYTATVGTGCTSVATATIVTASLPVGVTVSSDLGPSVCTGATVILTANVTNGGANPSFTWYKNGVATGYAGTGLAFGTYVVSNPANFVSGDIYSCRVLSSAGGCMTYPTGVPAGTPPAYSNNLTMTVNAYPTVTISGGPSLCNGVPTNLTSVHSAGTYQWYLDGGAIGGATADNYGATLPGIYTLEVTNAGCPTISNQITLAYSTNNITVTAGANGTITPIGPTSVNCGFNQVYSITPNPGYSICPGTGVLVDGVPNAGAIGSGTYTFTNVTAPHTISATFCIVGCATPPTANANTSAVNSTCANVNYTLAGSVGGSATPGSSTWSTSGTGTFNPNNVFTTATSYTPSLNDATVGSVTLTLTTNDPDDAGPCLASTSSFLLTIKPIPTLSVDGNLGLCPSANTTLTATASFPSGTITGYQWYNGATPIGTAVTQVISATGNYSVVVTASNACTNTQAFVIGNFAAPTISIIGSNIICTNSTTVLTASATAGSGSIGANSYQWARNSIDIIGATTAVLNANTAGNYTVTVTNSNGCSTISAIHVIAADNAPLNGLYTIGVGPASCTNYVSFASAISDLNLRGVGGLVRFDVPGGYTETAPPLGLKLGSATLNASLSSTNVLIFQKSGAGANPLISAYASGVGLPTSAAPDGIWSINGANYVTIDAIDLIDNNAASPATMEYGFGLFKLSAGDGAQNNTIQNCVITLKRENSTGGTTPMVDGSVGILVINSIVSAATTPLAPASAAGANSNNKFYSNTIQNCNTGIALSGFAAGSPFITGDTGNDIGGIAPSTGNSILNYGGGVGTPANGVRLINQWSANVSYNTINNNNGAGINHTNTVRGIFAEVGTSANITINNNTISTFGGAAGSACTAIENGIGSTTVADNTVLISNNIITGAITAATGANWTAISNTSTAATVNIIGNTIQNATLPGTGNWFGVSNTGAATNVNISSNTFQAINLTTTGNGAFSPISNNAVVTTLTIDGNSINNNTKTAGTAAVSLINVGATASNPVNAIVSNNTISNNTVTGANAAIFLHCINGNIATMTVSGNTIYNNGITMAAATAAVATVNGYNNNVASTLPETITNNIVRKLYVTGTTATGLQVIRGIFNATNSASNRTVSGNTIDSLYCTSTISSAITAISSAQGGTINIFKNKIQSLYPGQSATAGAFAKGINIQQGIVTVYNNIINIDLATAFAPAANGRLTGTDAVKGIEVTNGTTINLYYNTIRLNGAGSGVLFGSSGIGLTATGPAVTLKNNIIDNLMTPGGQATVPIGASVAFRRSAAAVTGYASGSNNNLFWAGAASTTNLLYYDGTNSYQILDTYQFGANIAPRETASVSFAPLFISATDLRPDPSANCAADGQGTPITIPFPITDDYAAVPRDATLPDIGAYEFTGAGGSPTWRGLSTDWMNVNNWCGVLPTVTTDVVIPNGVVNYPVITTGGPIARNVTIVGGGTANITINAGGTLSIKGHFANSGTLTNNGTIVLNGTTSQNFPGAAGTVAAMNILEVNNVGGGVNFDKAFSITGAFLPTLGTVTLNANNITIRSTATGTARVGVVGTNNAFVYNSTGRFVIERYIAIGNPPSSTIHGKTWQFLAVPTKGDFLKTSWMENEAPGHIGGPTGFGTMVTSEKANATARGYDLQTVPGPSLKTYVPATNTWASIDDGTTSTSAVNMTSQKGYMVFVRGDRSIQTLTTANPTVLRTSGRLYAPGIEAPVPVTVPTGLFEAIANPYASAINFTALGTTNVDNRFYVWDPKLGSSLGLGAYQTLDVGLSLVVPGGTTNYPAFTTMIQSGQAFFVKSNAAGAQVSFSEAAKTTGSSVVFKPANSSVSLLRVNMFAGTGSSTTLADGNLAAFSTDFSNDLDEEDAVKIMNASENFGMTRSGKSYIIEKRSPVIYTDTIFYSLGNMVKRTYELRFEPEAMPVELEAFLVDKYLAIKTPVSLTAGTEIAFDINDDPASAAADRFMVVFKRTRPVKFASIKATKQGNNIMVDWKIENELNMQHYDVEKSADGINFSKLNEQAAKGNGTATVDYNWLDTNPWSGDNFYRVRSVANSGEVKYSDVVKVNMPKITPAITVFPNPVQEDGVLFVSMNSKPAGIYTLRLANNKGQQVMSKTINHTGGNNVYTIEMDKLRAHGNYLLTVTGADNVKLTFKIVY